MWGICELSRSAEPVLRSLQRAREWKGRWEISVRLGKSVPPPPQFESEMWWWLKPRVLLTMPGEQGLIPGRGRGKLMSQKICRDRSDIWPKNDRLSTCSYPSYREFTVWALTWPSCKVIRSATNEPVSLGVLCWAKQDDVSEVFLWLILIAAVSSWCVGL